MRSAEQPGPSARRATSESDAAEPIVGVATLVAVTLVLLLMTAVNIGLAYVDLHGFNSLVALAIAAVEIVIMAWCFMHLRWSAPMARVAALVGLLWLAILMVGTMDDLLTRSWIPVPGK